MKRLHDRQEAVLHRLFAVGAVLGPAMTQGLADQGLTPARAEVIFRLHQLGPMNQRQLSQVLQCSPRNVTGLVDALEEADLLARQPHPDDRRAILVTLTKEGQAAANTWSQQARDLAARLLADFDTSQLTQLGAALDVILKRLDAPAP